MNAECERLTEIARENNRLAQTKPDPYVMKASEEASFIKALRKQAVPDETLHHSKPTLASTDNSSQHDVQLAGETSAPRKYYCFICAKALDHIETWLHNDLYFCEEHYRVQVSDEGSQP
jgi:hypothetical protein